MTSLDNTLAKLAAIVCLCLASLGAQALELRGFRGVSWGDGADSLGPASAEQAGGDVVCYRRERENMLFGERTVNQLRYCFHQDKLFMVSLDSAAGMTAMRAELQRTYGPPREWLNNTASWGNALSVARADLVSLSSGGSRSRLTIRSNQFEPTAAKNNAVQAPHRAASAL
jgi:hypothetical protein